MSHHVGFSAEDGDPLSLAVGDKVVRTARNAVPVVPRGLETGE